MSGEILKAKNDISMVLGGRKTIAPIFSPFLTFGCGHPSVPPRAKITPYPRGDLYLGMWWPSCSFGDPLGFYNFSIISQL